MKIQTISNIVQRNFNGLVSPIKNSTYTSTESLYGGEYDVHTHTDSSSLTYYKFTDDSPEELASLRKKYEYRTKIDESSGTTSADIYYKEGNVKVVNVPVTFSQYDQYINNKLTSREEKKVEKALKDASLQALLDCKIPTFNEALKQVTKAEAARKREMLALAAHKLIEYCHGKKAEYQTASSLLG